MASKTERTVVNAAGLVQGIVLVTFQARPGLPARFWLYAAFAVAYGICETMNGN
jgi:hypothetical protein